MVCLYLVLHAVAFDEDASAWPDDRKRPLTPHGERAFRKAAERLREVAGQVDVILTSPWVRAWHTATIAHERARWPAPEVCEALAGDRQPAETLEALRAYASATSI